MLYEYECPAGHIFERVLPVSEYKAPQPCDCGQMGQRIISRTHGFVQRECVYDSPIDGRPVTSWAQRREDMARNNCQEYDPGMRQDYDRRIAREDAILDAKFEETIEAEIERMPSRKREQLQAELDGGAVAMPERSTVSQSTTVTTSS
jgi:hypothetical protein